MLNRRKQTNETHQLKERAQGVTAQRLERPSGNGGPRCWRRINGHTPCSIGLYFIFSRAIELHQAGGEAPPIFSSGWRTPACPLLARQSQQRGTGGQGDTSCGSWTQHLLTQLHPPARSLQPNPPGEGHTITQLRFGWSRVTFWASRSHLWGGKYQIVGVTITLGGA